MARRSWGICPNLAQEFGADVNPDRIYVFTPDGPCGGFTAARHAGGFCLSGHTEVGNKCRGAKVNGRIVPLTYLLKNGEQVEILTSPNGHPSRDWLYPEAGYIHTSRARAKVAHWFKLQARDQNVEEGRQLLLRELDRLDLANEPLTPIAGDMNMKSVDDMFAAIGAGDLRVGQIVTAVLRRADTGQAQQELPLLRKPEPTAKPTTTIFILRALAIW